MCFRQEDNSIHNKNEKLIRRWLEEPEEEAKAIWKEYSEVLLQEYQNCSSGGQFQKHVNHIAKREASHEGNVSAEEKERGRLSVMFLAVLRSFEEVFLPEGRNRVHWRYFPEGGNWKDRAESLGVLFLLARYFTAHQQPRLSRVERTQWAIELAEAWGKGLNIPVETDLEAFLFAIWHQRGANVVREFARREQTRLDETIISSELSKETVYDPLRQSKRLGPNFLERENFLILHMIFLSVCKDEIDEGILRLNEEGNTEEEIAKKLASKGVLQSANRKVVNGRWNTLVKRARLLFKMYSIQEEDMHSELIGLGTPEAIESLSGDLQNILTPVQKSTSVDFWLLLFRLSLSFSKKNKMAPGQNLSWNAFSQVWQKATKAIIAQHKVSPDSYLIKRLVSHWLRGLKSQLEQKLSPEEIIQMHPEVACLNLEHSRPIIHSDECVGGT